MKFKLLLLLSLLCFYSATALASGPIITNWKNATDGDFSDGAKWTNGIPGSIDTAIFDLGASAPGYEVTLNTTRTIRNLKVLNDTVTLDLNSQILNITTNFDLSQGGSGNTTSLTIDNGTVNSPDLLTTNSAGSGGQSTLTITNNGILNVSGAADIGKNGPGNVFVDGAGSQLNATDLKVGLNASGDGLLEINKGATTSINNSTLDVIIGDHSNSQGQIKVNSTGGGDTLLDVMSNLVVGDQGSGTLRLIGSAADVLVGGNLTISANSGSTGLVELYDNAYLTVTGDIVLGDGSGLGDGTLKIYGGGSGALVESFQDVNIGAVGTSGPTIPNTVEIHYDGTLKADNVTVGDNGLIELLTSGPNQGKIITMDNVTNYGIIKGAGKILTDEETLYNFGTLAPDNINPLDIFNTVVFENGSDMQVNFIDDDVSQLNVFGNLNINSADLLLIFDQEFIPTLNTSFDVLTWSLTRTGTFDNILVDELLGDALAGLSFLSSYDPAGAAGALQITIVPEPSTWALMGMGCLFIFWRVRRRD